MQFYAFTYFITKGWQRGTGPLRIKAKAPGYLPCVCSLQKVTIASTNKALQMWYVEVSYLSTLNFKLLTHHLRISSYSTLVPWLLRISVHFKHCSSAIRLLQQFNSISFLSTLMYHLQFWCGCYLKGVEILSNVVMISILPLFKWYPW